MTISSSESNNGAIWLRGTILQDGPVPVQSSWIELKIQIGSDEFFDLAYF